MVRPLVLSLSATAVLLVVVAVVLKLAGATNARAGLVVSLLVALFFSYGHVWDVVGESVRLHRNLLAIWSLIAVVGTITALRIRPSVVRTVTGGLNVLAGVLVAVNVVPVIGFAMAADDAPGNGPSASVGRPSDADAPDIWYLVFDRYAGQEALQQIYGFDNRPFIEELERRGFDVAEQATANYLKTALSIASTLQMDYLDLPALSAEASAPDDWTPLYRMLQGSYPVETYLHERGYTYLHLGVRRGATYINSAADRVFVYADQTEFSAVLADTTMLRALESMADPNVPIGTAGIYGANSVYELNTIEQIAVADSARPRFVFAHFLLPHPPYLFNADGSWVTPAQRAARSDAEEYLEQVRFVNDRALRLLDLLDQHADGRPPVVLIQADEGPFPDRYAQDEESFAWPDATADELLQKFSILSAYRLPDGASNATGLTEETTPVNSFRIIFNAVFGADFALLPDRNLVFVDQRHLYDMVDVTDRVRAAE